MRERPDPVEQKGSMVLLDDTGSPGQTAGSTYLDPARYTWIAVVADKTHTSTIYQRLPAFLANLKSVTGLDELHCSDLYNGKRCKEIALDVRLSFFEELVSMFCDSGVSIRVQSVSPYTLADFSRRGIDLTKPAGSFRLNEPKWLALFLLLIQVKELIKTSPMVYGRGAYFYADEGLRQPGRGIRTELLDGVSPDSTLYFCSSKSFPPIQLADFAAFGLNRTQWLLTKRELTDLDKTVLRIFQPLAARTANLKLEEIDLDAWSPDGYERVIDDDRLRKGLPPLRRPDDEPA
jgi:hypothetical protein